VIVTKGRGISIIIVPVWPGPDGIAAVDVIVAVAPLTGLKEVMVVNNEGTWTMMVPNWPGAVGAAAVNVMGIEAPLTGLS
jgi:hypothetical protein